MSSVPPSSTRRRGNVIHLDFAAKSKKKEATAAPAVLDGEEDAGAGLFPTPSPDTAASHSAQHESKSKQWARLIGMDDEQGSGSERAEPAPDKRRCSRDASIAPREGDPIAITYSVADASKLFGLRAGRLRHWVSSGLLQASGASFADRDANAKEAAPSDPPPEAKPGRSKVRSSDKGQRKVIRFSFADLVAIRTAKALVDQGVPTRRIREAVSKLQASMPSVSRPLTEMRVMTDGTQLLVHDDAGAFEPITGQRMLDFSIADVREEVVQTLFPDAHHLRCPSEARALAYEYYIEGCRLDEEETTWRQAEEAYRRALDIDPSLANAWTNLGNLHLQQRRDREAEACYHQALSVDKEQPEALYNLGFLHFERDQFYAAQAAFERAIRQDPAFADAHFNMALVLEALGETISAVAHWRTYLELEPSGSWAVVARRHLRALGVDA